MKLPGMFLVHKNKERRKQKNQTKEQVEFGTRLIRKKTIHNHICNFVNALN